MPDPCTFGGDRLAGKVDLVMRQYHRAGETTFQLQELGYRRMQSTSLKPGHQYRDIEKSSIGTSLVGEESEQAGHRYQRQLLNVGLTKLHGLRHACAQQRYLELTCWKAPVAGGPTSKHLTPEQLAPDYEARVIVSHELGHARVEIAAVYLGR